MKAGKSSSEDSLIIQTGSTIHPQNPIKLRGEAPGAESPRHGATPSRDEGRRVPCREAGMRSQAPRAGHRRLDHGRRSTRRRTPRAWAWRPSPQDDEVQPPRTNVNSRLRTWLATSPAPGTRHAMPRLATAPSVQPATRGTTSHAWGLDPTWCSTRYKGFLDSHIMMWYRCLRVGMARASEARAGVVGWEGPQFGVLPGHGSCHDGGLSHLPEQCLPHEHGESHPGSLRSLLGLGFQTRWNHQLDALFGGGSLPDHGGKVIPGGNRVNTISQQKTGRPAPGPTTAGRPPAA
jgi:hypothetical protein